MPYNPALKLPPEKVEEIVSLYNNGMSAMDVQKATGVGFSTVIRWVRNTGNHVRTPQEGKILKATAIPAYANGQGELVKVCVRCKVERPVCRFRKAPENYDQLCGVRKDCQNARNRERYPLIKEALTARMRQSRKQNPEKHREYEMRKRFGIGYKEYNEMFTLQGNKCAGCGVFESDGNANFWQIDHDHKCCPSRKGRVCGKCTRGILCMYCNLTLGNAKENRNRLTGLVHYLDNNFSKLI